ncbi:DNA polymerase III subunit gamma/tau [Methylomarinovum caldicuralii]|uniref:DNA polymerase III subunit gamma/tau n=1 Tax=Methylomarinovum caldicuralii TaxID=438856 RepID=A0AAU9CIX4_9GAMM|nr:DNA polymerase III subunit gamma/tau [Methylomarinovum caldicuralii]BCX81556.1 DNA polymerase III subunit gamma/tau [Methylomarinovum caldicuralii]
MSYLALARKWRPKRFSEITGQSHVVKVLQGALIHDRIHHAYLFTGTRGVGKTTLARIFAKALNCDQVSDGEPCGRCQTCREVDEGRFADLIEVDAASRTRVEDTRELLENAQFAPTAGRYKIYLIDEVHMLSGHSFNALLKTLEEPPPHVKFLLATTDPQKIPVTVLSRCLQFNLTRLSPAQIERRLAEILAAERVPYEAEALKLLAQAADGSLRDALSLLDQAIVYGDEAVRGAAVAEMLGGVTRRAVQGVVEALAAADARAVMAEVGRLAEQAADFGEVLKTLLSLLHRIALAQQLPETVDQDEARDWLLAQAQALSPEDVQLYYQIGLLGQKDLPWAPDPRTGLEMTLLRMLAFRPAAPGAAPAMPVRKPAAVAEEPAVQEETPMPTPEALPAWNDLVQRMRLPGMVQELAHHCVLEKLEGDRCELVLEPAFEHLAGDRLKARLAEALAAALKRPVKLAIRIGEVNQETPAAAREREQAARQQAAEQAIAGDETVKLIEETFDARIVPGSVRPRKD